MEFARRRKQMTTQSFLKVGLILMLSITSTVWAQNRCIQNGKVLITDQPCPSQQPAPGQVQQAPLPSNDQNGSTTTGYSTAYGPWRGQVQFQAHGANRIIHEALSVVSIVIDIDPLGKIKGSSPENSCVLQGIAAPGMFPTSLSLDVTLSGCRYAGLNRRLFGTLNLNQAQKYAQLALNGNNANPFGMVFFDIKGTLRR